MGWACAQETFVAQITIPLPSREVRVGKGYTQSTENRHSIQPAHWRISLADERSISYVIPVESNLIINTALSIPLSEIHFRFARSGGPGGQNVNKVETRVELLFDVLHSPSLTTHQRNVLVHELGSKIDSGGLLHIIAQASRSQWQNRELAVSKFVEILQKALTPRKRRVKTKATRAAKERRLEGKKRRGAIKQTRKFERE